jgi:hypothetical protein
MSIVQLSERLFKMFLKLYADVFSMKVIHRALPTELLSHNLQLNNGGPDGTRTRDLLRDRQAF